MMKKITEKYMPEVIDLTRALIKYDSSLAPALPGYPFGKPCGECLEYFLGVAQDMGFETKNYDNYIGEVIWGDGDDFAILCHLDVVPAGTGWTHDPFGAEMSDEVSKGGTHGMKIWGRGAVDDKAPAAVILYAMKALRDSGFTPARRLKLILGCNEEAGWACIDHYNECAKLPREGFTPDADFPVIYAEFGILHLKCRFSVGDIPLTSISAGDAINMVPQYATATVDGRVIEAHGLSAHASRCEEGDNALKKLFGILKKDSADIERIYTALFADEVGLTGLSDSTGFIRFSPDLAAIEDGELAISVDIRYPATLNERLVLSAFDTYGIRYEIISHKEPLYNDPDSPLIKTLSGVYNEYSGKDLAPVAIGGGTYARALECGVAFGPEVAGGEFPIHAPDEFITLDHLRFMLEIYTKAIYEIGK